MLSACLPISTVLLSFSASAADYTIASSKPPDADQNMYSTLRELLDNVTPSDGDTLILHNDDSSLTKGLNAPVNIVSSDMEALRTVDLAGLANAPLFTLSTGIHTMNMDSVIFANAQERVFDMTGGELALEIDGDHVRFEHNHNNGEIKNHPTQPYVGSLRWSFGGAVYLQGENTALQMQHDVSLR